MTDIQFYWITRESLEHHTCWGNLLASSAAGCHLCSLFLNTRETSIGFLDKDYEGVQLYVVPERQSAQENGIKIYLTNSKTWQKNDLASRPVSYVVLFLHTRDEVITSRKLRRACYTLLERDIKWRASTSSETDLQNISKWLKHCLDHHQHCRQSLMGQRPTRLLDLEPGFTSDDLRLTLASDCENLPYVTLSYSWGKSASVILTDECYDEFKSRIELKRLPKTIREAIEICRRLSIRYLWVDALCIIQGNSNDFTKEISRMGSIYAGSLFTIAAADSINSESGCFRDRMPLKQEPCRIWEEKDHTAWFVTEEDFCHVEQHILDARSWVYQERLMSPRTVHFCRNDVMWECREQRICERCSRGDPVFLEATDSERPDRKNIFKLLHGNREQFEDTGEFQRIWSSILHEYSQTVLSNDDDRLSALAGIAQIPQQILHQESSFGMWYSFLADDILWYTLKEFHQEGAPRDYNSLRQNPKVPSWSWIGLRDIIVNLTERRTFSLELTKTVYCVEFSELPVRTGFESISGITKKLSQPVALRLRSRLIECRPIPMEKAPQNDFKDFWQWILVPVKRDLSPKMEEYEASLWKAWLADEACLAPQPDPLEVYPLSKIEYHPDVEPMRPQVVFCCPLKRIFHDKPTKPVLLDYGLVLEPIESYKNRFRRIGAYLEGTMPFQMEHLGLEYPKVGVTPYNSQEWIQAMSHQMIICGLNEPMVDIEIF